MEERFGVKGSTVGGIFFVEQLIPGARRIDRVEVEIKKQNANLDEVKREMAEKATKKGATAIQAFRYGQRKKGWYGEGEMVVV
ncbi:hypothetical protein [Sporichthya sp.]|uniref:hypothetical protein n=1 Tax=Sporichthya sp. TaxID=65475 RepID=UPI0018065BB2|nr:hypothetical protein [Sporichthya sp.]MBA3744930.1 hypothetical protein [Sporichthya sp.]